MIDESSQCLAALSAKGKGSLTGTSVARPPRSAYAIGLLRFSAESYAVPVRLPRQMTRLSFARHLRVMCALFPA
jgi:hypothetical protein